MSQGFKIGIKPGRNIWMEHKIDELSFSHVHWVDKEVLELADDQLPQDTIAIQEGDASLLFDDGPMVGHGGSGRLLIAGQVDGNGGCSRPQLRSKSVSRHDHSLGVCSKAGIYWRREVVEVVVSLCETPEWCRETLRLQRWLA
jgi:hypothetical protein